MGRTNAEWHRAHPMPRNPTLAQRIAWHREHAANCACRKGDGADDASPVIRHRAGAGS